MNISSIAQEKNSTYPLHLPLDESQNPYRGLESFDREHSGSYFLARTALIQRLYQFAIEIRLRQF